MKCLACGNSYFNVVNEKTPTHIICVGELDWRRVRDSNPRFLAEHNISSYLRASFDEIIKVTLRHHSIEQTLINQGVSGINHEFTTLRLKPRI